MSLVFQYNFEDDYTDESGNSHTLTPVGSPTFVDGKVDRALLLNGLSQYALTSSIPPIDVHTGITLAAWVFPHNTAVEQSIVHRDGLSRMTFGLQMLAGGRVEYLYYRIDTGQLTRIRTDALITEDQWQHLAVTQLGSTATIYVDGVSVPWVLTSGSLAFSNRKRTNRDTYVGVRSSSSRHWNGPLDDLRGYDHALSASEIAELANPNAGNTRRRRIIQQMQGVAA